MLSFHHVDFFNFIFLSNLNFVIYSNILLLLCGDIELNPGPQRVNKARILYCNIRGLYGNFSDLAVASSNYDIILCSETLVSNHRSISEILLPNFRKPFLIRRDAFVRARGLSAYIRKGFNATLLPDLSCGCHEVQVIRVASRLNNFYVFSLYRNPDLDDSIYDCCLTKMALIQETDQKSCFVFVGDLNAHHQQWLNSLSPTNRHGHAALDFSNLSGCTQLVTGPTHNSGNRLDLLLSDVPDVVEVKISPPIGKSDHSAISFDLLTNFNVPKFTVSRRIYLKSRANWNNIARDLMDVSWNDIFKSDEPEVALNDTLMNIVSRRIPSKVIKKRSQDKVWFNEACQDAFNRKQAAYSQWSRNKTPDNWQNFIRIRSEALAVYDAAQADHNEHTCDNLTGITQPHKWWSTLKSFLFGEDSSLPPLRSDDGTPKYSPEEKADLLSAFFQSKQCHQDLDLPPTCSPEPILTKCAFRSSEIKSYMLDLDSYGGIDPTGIFPLFFKNNAAILAPKLAFLFRLLIRAGKFPLCWRIANITAIPKGTSPSHLPSEYRPISITPVISKLYEKLLARRLNRFIMENELLPATQFGFRKGVGTCDALTYLVHQLQSNLDAGRETRLVSLDFSSAFDRVNHKALLYKLRAMGIGGPFHSILNEFLSNRKQQVVVDGKCSSVVDVVSGVPQGSVLGPVLFTLYTADMWQNLENDLLAYADDTSLYSVISSPNHRMEVSNSLNRDLIKISSWCTRWGMTLNARKTHSIIFSRSRALNPVHPFLLLNNTYLETSNNVNLLGVTLDSKLTFEAHLRSVSSSIAQKTGLLRKCRKTLGENDAVLRSFFAFILPKFEYCSVVWMSAADCHLRLLDRAINNIKFLLPNLTIDLHKRRLVGALSFLFKIIDNNRHPLYSALPEPFVAARLTRYSNNIINRNSKAFSLPRYNTTQYSRCFIPNICKEWNGLTEECVSASDITLFKSMVNKLIV